MDSIDKKKTRVPWWLNPPKTAGNATSLSIKLIGVLVHGIGTFLYWATPQVSHGSNLMIEILRRTLLKLFEAKGHLPPTLHLQLDNASDNKSKLFFSFLAFLVEKRVFNCIKVSYLIVGHTHEDIDSYFSALSRFFKFSLKKFTTISAFLSALKSAFVSPGLIPKCTEQVEYCYDCSELSNKFLDPNFARFDLNESTGDKIHHFVLRQNLNGKAVMQYKLYRYSNAVYPRKYMTSDTFVRKLGEHNTACQDTVNLAEEGIGQVITATPLRDEDKKKIWIYTVQFKNSDGTFSTKDIQESADTAITMFPASHCDELPHDFPREPFNQKFDEHLAEVKASISVLLESAVISPEENEEWLDFFASISKDVDNIQCDAHSFRIPGAQTLQATRHGHVLPVRVDDGARDVDIVQHSGFTAADRRKKLKVIASEVVTVGERLEKLERGMFLVVQLKPTWENYPHDYIIAEVQQDIAELDTTNPNEQFEVQVYCFSVLNNINSKLFPWRGAGGGGLWKETIMRSMVKAIVAVTPKGKKLTPASIRLIQSTHF
jgi:hypothetical protein